ncbi:MULTISPECIES: helix-turn-helix domain-containing protein [Clostridium]|uniref:helix-turn-helix domain-containing protein n=1 Tax=Clostridium TaxID=1485 RepID=UPI000825A7A9|nr:MULTISPECIES: helix-turn-helix transcriptional regulator [Clostridium]PJI06600.1 XRE family transcriptional regulator [Clostridium sp. CT7]
MKLSKLAREKGFTSMYQLSKKAHVGVSTLSEIENGIRMDIRLNTAVKIAHALGVSVEKINLCIGDAVEDENKKSYY